MKNNNNNKSNNNDNDNNNNINNTTTRFERSVSPSSFINMDMVERSRGSMHPKEPSQYQ
jgi:hypothetical protein